jgi:hypothetical protein
MAVEYKAVWVGSMPHAILLTAPEAHTVLYYETGFEQLHPTPDIIHWMEEQGYLYQKDWSVATVSVRHEWAICLPNEKIAELFMMKWL